MPASSWSWLRAGGDVAALMRTIDWAATPIGPVERWPQSLKTTLAMMLHAKHPMFLWWGQDLVQFYNDAYVPRPQPSALGEAAGAAVQEDARWTRSPVFTDDGSIGGTLAVVTETHDDLLAELRDANAAKDEFLAMLGHELRNPLAPIVSALDLMRTRDVPEIARERVVIERQVTHLVRMVDDLLDVSRLARGKVELRVTVTDVGDIVERAIEVCRALISERSHVLEIAVPTGLHWRGDSVRLTQVISNLLTNAARYTDAGGALSVVAVRESESLVLRVVDNGRGIDAALMPKIFDAFVQGARTFDRRDGGLGLGLSVVRSLVQLHEGTVDVVSAGVGRGSTFTVRLPGVVDVPLTPALSGPIPIAGLLKRVLVVDDNVDAAELLAELLQTKGFETAVAHDGDDALATFATFAPEIAILDIGLPGMDGYELARRIRALPDGDKARLLALTGYGQPSDRALAIAAGFDEHLVKPIDPVKLRALLKS